MQSTAAALTLETQLEDPLSYLPCSPVLEYSKGDTIYSPDQLSSRLYLVMSGKAKVSRLAQTGQEVLVDIYQADDFFGEAAILNLPYRAERATAMEDTRVMTWSVPVLMDLVLSRPHLAVALLQILAQRSVSFQERIESFGADNVPRRLARSLIRFSDRGEAAERNGPVVRIAPITHALLAQYVGTSREVITTCMNEFRRKGYMRYSRTGIILNREALQKWLR